MDLPILNSPQVRAAEEAAFARGAQVEALMDKAGAGVARAVTNFFAVPGKCIVFAGKGHNGGDALVAAEQLKRAGWKIDIRLAFAENDCSELTHKKLLALRAAESCRGHPVDGELARSQCHTIILDGLLGLGARPPLREPIRGACQRINRLRKETGAFVFAVDLPTGLDGDSGETDRDCVVADFTATIGFVKAGLIADRAIDYVGRLEIVPLDELHSPEKKAKQVIAGASTLRGLLPRREYDAYKNKFGRIAVVAGSKGFVGAALMSTDGALRAGAGLVELFVPAEIYEIVASAAPMESMVKPIQSHRELLKQKADVWALGPGLGGSHAAEILELIEKVKQPMVIDADGLNVLSEKTSLLSRCKGPRLLTPHPGEMKRLFPTEKSSRSEIASKFCRRFPVTLLLKGSRTIVAQRDRPLSYNTTGNPGMATGGMGDVLTGVCAGLIGQGLSLFDAARMGAWLCGRAAEIAIFNGGQSEQSLLPRDVLDHLGAAFKELAS